MRMIRNIREAAQRLGRAMPSINFSYRHDDEATHWPFTRIVYDITDKAFKVGQWCIVLSLLRLVAHFNDSKILDWICHGLVTLIACWITSVVLATFLWLFKAQLPKTPTVAIIWMGIAVMAIVIVFLQSLIASLLDQLVAAIIAFQMIRGR